VYSLPFDSDNVLKKFSRENSTKTLLCGEFLPIKVQLEIELDLEVGVQDRKVKSGKSQNI